MNKLNTILYCTFLIIAPLFSQDAKIVTPEQHLQHAPENPSFFYETKFIPGHGEEKLFSSTAKKEIIIERINQSNEQNSSKKVRVSIQQIVIILGVVILFVLYRKQALKKKGIR